MLNRHGWRLMPQRVEDEFDCIEAIFGEDFRRAQPSSLDSAAVRVQTSQGIWIHLEAPLGYPEQKRLVATVDKNWSFRGEHQFKELDAGILGFLETLPMDTEMAMQVVEYARDLIQQKVPPAINDACDNEQLGSQTDFSVSGPVMLMSGEADAPPIPGGSFLTIRKRVRVVGTRADLGDLADRVGTLARYDRNKGQWWVQFPKFKESAIRKRLLWDCAFVRPSNLLPLEREEAFDEYKRQLNLAVRSSLGSLNEEEEARVLQECLNTEEEDELMRAIIESLTETEKLASDSGQGLQDDVGISDWVSITA